MSALHPTASLQATPSHGSQDNPTNNGAVSSLCFLPEQRDYIQKQDNINDDSESDDSDEFELSMATCPAAAGGDTTTSKASADRLSMSGARLASCHVDGRVHIWDLSQQKAILECGGPERPLGLALRRLGDGKDSSNDPGRHLLYQTRDPSGTVSIHDPHQDMMVVTQWQTLSRTFCAAAPCGGDSNLVALPSAEGTNVAIRDCRVPATDTPAFHFPAATSTRCGMLTSLAMMQVDSEAVVAHLIVVCGMESGSLYLHDLRGRSDAPVSLSLGTDPVLSVDIAPSSSSSSANAAALVAVAGLGGDAAEIEELADGSNSKGRAAVVKAVHGCSDDQPWTLKQRARVGIGVDATAHRKKSGVSICRFRPDGRLFAVGGWDWRLRLYDRSSNAAAVALLKGHTGSVDAMDWHPDPDSGLLATGASDGVINIWKCFVSS